MFYTAVFNKQFLSFFPYMRKYIANFCRDAEFVGIFENTYFVAFCDNKK